MRFRNGETDRLRNEDFVTPKPLSNVLRAALNRRSYYL